MATKKKMKKAFAKVHEQVEYIAEYKCPYCKKLNSFEPEEDGVTIVEQCWKCKKKYEVRIPNNSF